MTPQEQRIAIAEACGWVREWADILTWNASLNDHTGDYEPVCTLLFRRMEKCFLAENLPDYLSDLNAMQKILQGSLQYCQGFLDARKDYAPRNAYRLMRSDGRVMEEVPAREDVNIGQIAGWPSAEQYESAANKALERAKSIRERANAEL